MKIIFTAVAVALLYSSSVFAAAGVSWAAKEDYKNPKNEMGLCTEASSKQLFMKTGYCQSIMEILTNENYCPKGCDPKECPAAKFKEIKERFLQDRAGTTGTAKAKYTKAVTIDYTCDNKKENATKYLEDLAKDKDTTKFTNVMAQFFAMVAIETSDWDSQAKGNGGGEGLFGLTRKDMEDPKYRCGCELANPPDPLPGPEDGHHSLTCGTYMALVNISKDGTLFGGKNKTTPAQNGTRATATSSNEENKDTREGAAKIFKVLEVTDKSYEQNGTLTRMSHKMEFFCQNSAHSKTTTWTPTLDKMIGSETFK